MCHRSEREKERQNIEDLKGSEEDDDTVVWCVVIVKNNRLATWSANADHVCRPSSWGWALTIRS